ncbi:glycosyltransferase family 2 protein [Liquorilactobacillus capillatus]|uniref:Glycosyl transferase family 2 n=1 Tax=Liquorilactobacillus capillatus DSM 19910 TaxID=1423731 RepID=A0A0R1MB58_9LACO|nr:glycosyltransferase family 2 protein [Liquorilactobacillus capillatus]KRL02138.1 glycosyl transferase family 2 [Liquorilactobacillus capillatus DSM 19910]
MKAEVAILMSTYNGLKYLKDQINSILAQDYKEWDLYIRDDVSSDDTISILRDYEKKYTNIHIVENNNTNLGAKKSFLELTRVVNAKYYMFSDQDDFWLPQKVSATLKLMKSAERKGSNDIPVLVHTNYRIVDSKLNELRTPPASFKDYTDLSSLAINNSITGCTMMINDTLKQMIGNVNAEEVGMHDWWFGLIASCFGIVEYLPQVTILYRQHEGNVVGANTGLADSGSGSKVGRILRGIKKNMRYYRKELRHGSMTAQQVHYFQEYYAKLLTVDKEKELGVLYKGITGGPVAGLTLIRSLKPQSRNKEVKWVMYIVLITK